MARSKSVYKVIFHNQGKLYELHAKQVQSSSALLGFVEVDGLMFETGSSVLVDPSAERLKAEFTGSRRLYLPMHAVVRIEEVEKQGSNKISVAADKGENVTPFPSSFATPKRD